MKKQFKNRKAFEDIAKQLGFQDKTHNVVYKDPVTKKENMLLINNFNRFVKGMLMLSPIEQLEKLQIFKNQMEELVKAQEEARKEAQDSIKDIKIENPLAKEFQESSIEEDLKI